MGLPTRVSPGWIHLYDFSFYFVWDCVKLSTNEETEGLHSQGDSRHFFPRHLLRLVLHRLLARKAENGEWSPFAMVSQSMSHAISLHNDG